MTSDRTCVASSRAARPRVMRHVARAASSKSDTLTIELRTRTYDLDGLLELPHIRDAASRRTSFRQGLANLARAAAVDGPSPLDGIAPEALARSAKSALEGGLFEDLDWLSPAAVSIALYELASALPAGAEKRELGRRVVARLNEGPADVFAAVATRMALGTR